MQGYCVVRSVHWTIVHNIRLSSVCHFCECIVTDEARQPARTYNHYLDVESMPSQRFRNKEYAFPLTGAIMKNNENWSQITTQVMGRQQRTVAKGLDKLLKAQLLIDSEANSELNWTEIQALQHDYRGEVSAACCNRFQYLQNLKWKRKVPTGKYTEALNLVRESKLAPRFQDTKQ